MKRLLLLFILFLLNSYLLAQTVTLSLSAGGTGSGKVKVNGTLRSLPYTGNFALRANVSLEAVPDNYNTFTEWSGDLQGTTNPTSITLSGNRSVTANFNATQYSLTVNKEGSGTGQINVNGKLYSFPFSGNFNGGTKVNLLVVSGKGSTFNYWTGSLSGSQNPVDITIDGNKTVTAVIGITKYTLTINKGGNGLGRIIVDGKEYNLPFTGQYNEGTQVTMEAVHAVNSNFINWSGDMSGTASPTTITMDKDKTVDANFALIQYTLSLDKTGTGEGQVKVNGEVQSLPYNKQFDYGSEVILEAIPLVGSTFNTWEGDLKVNTNSVTVNMTSNKNISANFSSIPKYSLQINATGKGTGKVKINRIQYPLPYSGTFYSGEQVAVEAVPDTGSNFIQWSGDLQGTNNPITITMTSDKTVNADFGIIQYTLSLSKTGNGDGKIGVNDSLQTLPYSRQFNYGSQVVLEAVPANNNYFNMWEGNLEGNINPITITMTSNKNVSASFSSIPQFILKIDPAGNGWGKIKIDGIIFSLPFTGSYNSGKQITIEAVPDTGSTFSEWAGDQQGSNNPITITLTGNRTISVNFTLLQYSLNIIKNGSGDGKVNINQVLHSLPYSGMFNYGTQVIIEAITADGSTFSGWSGDFNGMPNPAAIVIDNNKSITVNFSVNAKALNIGKTGYGNGQVKINDVLYPLPYFGLFEINTQLNIEAVPDEGNRFTGWIGDLNNNTNPASIVMDKDVIISAEFVKVLQGTIELISPANGSNRIPINITFKWEQNLDTTTTISSMLEISKNESFDTLYYVYQIDNDGYTNNIYNAQLTGLEYKSKYFWRVKAAGNESQLFSGIWSFTTQCKPILHPSNLNAVVKSPNSIDLNWIDNSDNELHFLIERKDGDSLSTNAFQIIDTVAEGITSYNDTHFQQGFTYTYKVYACNNDTISYSSNEATVTTVTSVSEKSIPEKFSLSQNYPNPFNPSTVINYQLPKAGYVELRIYDIIGNEITTLVTGEKKAGYYQVVFDASGLSTGIYIYKLTAGEFIAIKKLMLMK